MSLQRPAPSRVYSTGVFHSDTIHERLREVVPPRVSKIVGFDTETWRIMNNVAPKVVCVSAYEISDAGTSAHLFGLKDGIEYMKSLLLDDSVHLIAHNAAFDTTALAVQSQELFALLTRAYKRGRVHCTKIAQVMLTCADTIANGDMMTNVRVNATTNTSSLTLAGCVKIYFNGDISEGKTDPNAWRLRYKELDGIPVDQWPTAAADYAIADAKYAADVFIAQQLTAKALNARIKAAQGADCPIAVLRDETNQSYIDFVMGHMSTVHGIRVNPKRVAATRTAAVEAHRQQLPDLVNLGLFKAAPKTPRGAKLNKPALQCLYFHILNLLGATNDPEFFSDGKVGQLIGVSTSADKRESLDRLVLRAVERKLTANATRLSDDQCEQLETAMTMILACADAESSWKEIKTFIEAVSRAKLNPDNRLRYRLNGLVATGRTSSSSPNLQNLPRGGGVRSCIEPSPGHVFLISDYSAAEFRTLGQINVDEAGQGNSEIARQYQADRSFDPHLFAATKMLEIQDRKSLTLKEAKAILKDDKHELYGRLKGLRQLAKALNFGLAGGLSPTAFVSYARGYNLDLTLAESQELCDMWFQVWGEMNGYRERRREKYSRRPDGEFWESNDDTRVYVFPRDGRARFCNRLTVSMNTPFQGLAASGIKAALRSIFEECHFTKSSPLFGSMPVLMVHDELVLESPYDGTPEGLLKLRAAAARFEQLMVEGMEKFTPDVPAEADVSISTRWTKDAKSAHDENGELLVWSPAEEQEEDDVCPADLDAEDEEEDDSDSDDANDDANDSVLTNGAAGNLMALLRPMLVQYQVQKDAANAQRRALRSKP